MTYTARAMGWNTSALFVENRTIEDVIRFLPDVFGYEPTGETATGEMATSGAARETLFLRADGDWVEAWDPDLRLLPRIEKIVEGDGPGTLAGTRALMVIFSSVTSSYGFILYEGGVITRKIFYSEGNVIDEYGEALPVEHEVEMPSWGYDEDFVWAVIESVTGRTHDLEAAYQVYAVEI